MQTTEPAPHKLTSAALGDRMPVGRDRHACDPPDIRQTPDTASQRGRALNAGPLPLDQPANTPANTRGSTSMGVTIDGLDDCFPRRKEWGH